MARRLRLERAGASARRCRSFARALGDHADEALETAGGTIGLTGTPEVVVDVLQLESLLAAGRFEEALALGTGELLPELDDEWVLAARPSPRRAVGGHGGAGGVRRE